jgi:hypothetical protein
VATRDAIACRPASIFSPSSSARSWNSGVAIVSSTATAAAQATGLPPNVPPSPPGSTASMIDAGPVTAASGRPPPSDLPETSRSGCAS